ncbi:pirin family protein [Flavobacteriaceae bacterium GF1]
MEKQIKHISIKHFEQNRSGFSTVNHFNNEIPIEPFLAFTEYHMNRPIFGPHPHAGVSVITYIHPDSKGGFINRDSLGDHSIIDAGGVHVTQAGSGIQHDEVPETTGVDSHGFQIWVNHSDKNRLVAPKALHANSNQVPEVVTEGKKVRVIHGNYGNKRSILQMVTPVTLLDVYLEPYQEIELEGEEMTFVYVVSGSGEVAEETISSQHLVLFDEEGDTIKIKTAQDPINFTLASGKPHKEPIVYGGPYVMTSQEQLEAAKRRFGRGEMGELAIL